MNVWTNFVSGVFDSLGLYASERMGIRINHAITHKGILSLFIEFKHSNLHYRSLKFMCKQLLRNIHHGYEIFRVILRIINVFC